MSTILVVDDLPFCRESVAEILRTQGFQVICASSGHEALSIMDKTIVELVLLDVKMPEFDGLATLGEMRKNVRTCAIPVILLTDDAQKETVESAIQFGANGYLLKSSFRPDELLARVQRCLLPAGGEQELQTANGDQTDRDGPPHAKTRAGTRFARWRTEAESARTREEKALPHQQSTTSRRTGARSTSGENAPMMTRYGGESSQSLDELTPIIEKKELVELVTKGLELRPLGISVHNVISTTSNAYCSAEDVARAVASDQAISIRILKAANSSAYSRGRTVDGIKSAIGRLGIQEVRKLVMTLGVIDEFGQSDVTEIDARLFWEHSLGCGLIASALAHALDLKQTEDCFLWGLLHDVGRLILLEHVPERYASVREAAEALDAPLERVEAKMLLLDHCDILSKALEYWHFGREFIRPVVGHHKPVARIKEQSQGDSQLVAIVALADRIAHALSLGSSGNDIIYPIDDLVEFVNLGAAAVDEIVDRIPFETHDLKISMLARASEDSWPDFLGELRGERQIRPLCVSHNPQFDAYRICLERMFPKSDEEGPNVGVIYMSRATELQILIKAFEEAENEAQAAGLPVLLICTAGQLDQEHPWLRSRPTAMLKAPVRVHSLLDVLESLVSAATPAVSA